MGGRGGYTDPVRPVPLLLTFLALLLPPVGAVPAPSTRAGAGAGGQAVAAPPAREPAPQGAVQETLRAVPAGVRTALLVTDVTTGEVLVAHEPDLPLIPASTVKLVTAAAVLHDRGGPGGWWSTELTVPAAEAGRPHVSALTLRGTADPTLDLEGGPNSLRALAKQAYGRGLREVGAVRLDLTRLDGATFKATPLGLPQPPFALRAWEKSPPASVADARRRMTDALIAELRRAGIRVRSGALAAAPRAVPYIPPARQDEAGNPLPPDLRIPAARRPEVGIASVRSAPVWVFLASMLRPSDNSRAEALLATLAAQPQGGGTLRGALELERATLQELGLDPRRAVLRDGSGLSRDNRLSPRLLTGLLKVMYDLPYLWPAEDARPALPPRVYKSRHNAFAELLPQAGTGEQEPDQAGRGGTLARRLVGSGLDVRAKTGTLPGVSALAGYVTTNRGRVLAFAVLMNGPESSPILTLRALQDELVRALAASF